LLGERSSALHQEGELSS